MKKILILSIICFAVTALSAQTKNYDDVAVIINDNSPESKEIGDYFKQARNIPDVNMIHINCSTDERVDSAGLFLIVNQVSDYLVDNNLTETINYLVTTKGIPIIFEGGNCDSVPGFNKCSAIDSELTLVVNHEEIIGPNNNSFENPYYDVSDYNFSQSNYGIYLVTRLDAYTVNDVKELINRSGTDFKVNKNTAQFIFDLAFAQDSNAISPLVDVLNRGNELVQSQGWNSIYSPYPSSFITDESNVLGYYSYVYQPSNKTLNYEWLNGSLAVLNFWGTASTFLEEENIYNELIIANIIEEGACGAAGYISSVTYLSQCIQPQVLYDKYLYGTDTIMETNPYYNLAESYYQAISRLSSVQVIVGDPKTSIVIGEPDGIDYNNSISKYIIFPNPARSTLTVEYTVRKNGITSINLYNLFGNIVYQQIESTESGMHSHSFDISMLPQGMYIIELESQGTRIREKLIVE